MTHMDAYVKQYQLQLPYKSHRTYLTNHMGSLSHHITALAINSLRGGHTHKHTCIHMFEDRSNYKKPGTRRPAAGMRLFKK